jgi:hypothetical protein
MSSLLELLFAIPMIMLRGYAIMLFWNWFLVPEGIPPITRLLNGIGISLVISLFTFHLSSLDKLKSQTAVEVITDILLTAITTFVMLGMGWIVHSLMVP